MNPETPFTIHGDEAVEARIVAWVLGEASAFETAELERLCEERPELLVFRRRMRALHGLLTEAEAAEPDNSWKLPPEKRRILDEIFGPENVVRLEPDKEHRIRRSGRRAMFAIAACLVLTIVVLRLVPRKYDGEAMIEIKPRSPSMTPLGTGFGESSGASQMTPQFFATEFEKIKSSNSLGKVVDNLELADRWHVDKETAVRKLKDSVTSENIRGTDLVAIRVRDASKQDASEIAMEVARAYKAYRSEIENRDADRAQFELNKAVRDQEDKVEERRKVLATIVRTKGIIYKGQDSFYGQSGVNEDQGGRNALQAEANKLADAREEAIKRGLDAQDYVDAKRDFETDQELLQKMRLKQIGQQMIEKMTEDSIVIHEGSDSHALALSAQAKAAAKPVAPASPAVVSPLKGEPPRPSESAPRADFAYKLDSPAARKPQAAAQAARQQQQLAQSSALQGGEKRVFAEGASAQQELPASSPLPQLAPSEFGEMSSLNSLSGGGMSGGLGGRGSGHGFGSGAGGGIGVGAGKDTGVNADKEIYYSSSDRKDKPASDQFASGKPQATTASALAADPFSANPDERVPGANAASDGFTSTSEFNYRVTDKEVHSLRGPERFKSASNVKAKACSVTTKLSGENTYTGETEVSAGTLMSAQGELAKAKENKAQPATKPPVLAAKDTVEKSLSEPAKFDRQGLSKSGSGQLTLASDKDSADPPTAGQVAGSGRVIDDADAKPADMGRVTHSTSEFAEKKRGEKTVSPADTLGALDGPANGVTNGLRSGDLAINGNSIDAILNNPNRTAGQPGQPTAASKKANADVTREFKYPSEYESPQLPNQSAAKFSNDADAAISGKVPLLGDVPVIGRLLKTTQSLSKPTEHETPGMLYTKDATDITESVKNEMDEAKGAKSDASFDGNVDYRASISGKPTEAGEMDPFWDTSKTVKPSDKDRSGSTEYEIHTGSSSQYLFRGVDLSEPKEVKVNLTDLMEEISATETPYSTFSLNINDASFQLAKAALAKGERPDPNSIKPEQFYNAVDYGDPAPTANEPVAATIEQSAHPIIPGRNLVRVALRTGSVGHSAAQALRLTLLVDQSGSMVREDRRAAMEHALAQLSGLLTPNDTISVIGFSRTPHLLADGMSGDQATKLGEMVNQTASEGGTNLEEAIKLGGQLARRHQLAGAQNRIVLFTDGAANLGDANPDRLATLVKAFRQQGLAFDIAGIGADGLNDRLLSDLARNGNGRYYVVGSEANDSFARQLAGAFRPAAENVKVQVNFNPQRVGKYKLIGFEKDRLKTEDFRNDAVDAAELAADEEGVAIYLVEPLADGNGELGEVSVRFHDVASGEMVERSWTLPYDSKATAFDRATPSMQLAGLSLLAAEKLRGGPLADAIDFKQLTGPAAFVRQFYGSSARVGDMLHLIDALK